MKSEKNKKSNQDSSSANNTVCCSESGFQTKIQRSLKVGSVNDPLEHEAENVANQVMRMPEPSLIQRKCEHCEEEQVQQKPLASFIQKMGSDSGTQASEGISSKIQSTRGTGSTLPENTKSFMETRFGSDFSHVKIHTGDYAVQMSGELNAQAFTVGNDIYFNKGQYNPSSTEGKHLLAHELTHVVQQSSGIATKKVQRVLVPRVWNCSGFTTSLSCNLSPCRAASGRIGRCFWGIPLIPGGSRCRCRDTSTDEPAPARFQVPSWLAYLLSATVIAAIVACFASGICEFGAVIAGLGAATAAAVLGLLRAAGVRDSGPTA